MNDKISINTASLSDRDALVVEIRIGNQQFAEISEENGHVKIEIYSDITGNPWCMPYQLFNETIETGKKRFDNLYK